MLVVDTNVVLALVLRDANVDAIEKLREADGEWVSPHLLFSEVRHILAKYVRLERLNEGEAVGALHAVADLVRSVSVESEASLRTACTESVSGYDAEFVALARSEGIRLATYDKRVLAACPDVAFKPIG